MEEIYLKSIVEAAIKKLNDAQKPLSELEITAGIVHRLKMHLGEDDKRHSSKGRFRKDSFKDAVDTSEWKKSISQLSDKKFILKTDEEKYAKHELQEQWTWANISYEEAIEYKLNNLKKIDPFKLEELVSKLLKNIYPDFDFNVTRKTGDQGIDVIGIREIQVNKKEAIYVQVKRFEKTVVREYADKFIGALNGLIKKHSFSHLTGLFVTTGTYSSTFGPKLKEAQEKYVSYSWWDGVELSRQMLKNGLGVKYSLDVDFWKEIDSSAVLESNKPSRKAITKRKPKSKSKPKKQTKQSITN
jgi:restriction endonuclease Mrr